MAWPRPLVLYKEILRTLQRWPSVRRQQVIQEIRAEFRTNMLESEAQKREKMIREAEDGLHSLRMQCGMNTNSNEISLEYDDALQRRQR